jgi:hypothetical protein
MTFSILLTWFLFIPIPIINGFFREKYIKKYTKEIHNTNRKCGPALGRVYKDKPSIIKAAIDPDMIRPMSSLDLPMAQITFQRDGHSQKFTFRIVGRGIGTGFAVMEPVLNVRNRGENE